MVVSLGLVLAGCGSKPPAIAFGSENTTEQQIFGEVITGHLRKELPGVEMVHNRGMGDTMVVRGAILSGAIDLYAEDAATALSLVLKEEVPADPDVALERMRAQYHTRYQLSVLNPTGLTHQFVVLALASANPPADLSSAGGQEHAWKIGATHRFIDRQDGLGQLTQRYKWQKSELPKSLDPKQVAPALRNKEIDFAAVYPTDTVDAPGNSEFTRIRDDQEAFPVHPLCIVAKDKTLAGTPGLRRALESFQGKLTNDKLRELVLEVDVKHRLASDVAKEFLAGAAAQGR